MKKILVATDFSPAAHSAADYAAALAKAFNASLHLLHVYMQPAPAIDMPVVWADTVEAMQREKSAQLEAEAASLKETYGIPVSTDAVLGFTGESLATQAAKEGADLVVMGMKGGRHSRFLGSNVITAIRKVRGPVLVVPEGYAFTPVKRITFSTDFSEAVSHKSLAPLLVAAQTFGARVDLVHIQKEEQEMDTDEIAGKMRLQRALEAVQHQFHTLVDDDVEEGIQTFIQNNPTDLLVMVAHRHSLLDRWLGTSHTKLMSYHTTVPLLVLHDERA
jgi:nucleotide-binding universal stress UspA family protein